MMKHESISNGIRIRRTALLITLLGIAFAGRCVADQLQWNSLPICRDAAKVIAKRPILVSFCSLADADFVELWRVRDMRVVATAVPDLYEIVVSAERLSRSEYALSSSEFPIPEKQWLFREAEPPGWFAVGIDLAYVYVYETDRSFRCLAQVLELPCSVTIEEIRLPDSVMQDIAIWL